MGFVFNSAYMKTSLKVIFILFFPGIFVACQKNIDDPNGNNKIVTGNSQVDTVTYWNAKISSSFADLANNEILDFGHCWSENHYPTISDDHSSFGVLTTPGSFTSTLAELHDGTEYYIRIYATLRSGTVYPDEFSLQTIKDPCDDEKFINYNGQDYAIVPIGDKCWMAENLNAGTRIEGNQQQTNDLTIQKYCYENNEANCETYGALYQWDELMNYSTSESGQGICPPGWHIPSDEEWKTAEAIADDMFRNDLSEWNKEGLRGSDVGRNLKSNDGWNNDGDGTDKYGFNVLPGGRHTSDGSFFDQGTFSWFWSSTLNDNSNPWGRMLSSDNSKSYRGYFNEQNGRYARCIKDLTTMKLKK